MVLQRVLRGIQGLRGVSEGLQAITGVLQGGVSKEFQRASRSPRSFRGLMGVLLGLGSFRGVSGRITGVSNGPMGFQGTPWGARGAPGGPVGI